MTELHDIENTIKNIDATLDKVDEQMANTTTTNDTEDNTFPVLYILMRTDLDSMNSGKAMAQASHASNAFAAEFGPSPANIRTTKNKELYEKWSHETTQAFGTVLVLDLQVGSELTSYVEEANALGLVAGVVHDPSYPVQDGDVTHHIPLDTCAYIFGDKANDHELSNLLSELDLHW